MGLYKRFSNNVGLERNGIWLDIGDTRIKLGRAGGKNVKYVSAMEKLQREHKRTLDHMPEEQSRKLLNKLYAETVVIDWLTATDDGTLDEEGNTVGESYEGQRWSRGISGPDGVLIPVTVDNVEKTLADLNDLAILIRQTAEDQNLFRQALLENIAGN